jgi:hypothetical protein
LTSSGTLNGSSRKDEVDETPLDGQSLFEIADCSKRSSSRCWRGQSGANQQRRNCGPLNLKPGYRLGIDIKAKLHQNRVIVRGVFRPNPPSPDPGHDSLESTPSS